ncbi:MAG: ABC transporter permease subunit [Thermoproteota archaeon]
MDRREVLDALIKVSVIALAALAVAPIAHLILTAAVEGGSVIARSGLKFFTEPPPPPGSRTYGILTSLVGTLELALISSVIGIPLAFMAAVLSVEFPSSLPGRVVRLLSRVLLEVPTVLVGMLFYILMVAPMGRPSILAASLALAMVMLPYVYTYVESALSSVPVEYREAGLALAMTRPQLVFRVVVPIAWRGVATGFLIGVMKAVGETAPLLFTLGRARSQLNVNPLGPGDSISLLIYDYAQAPYENMRQVAWGAALVLILALLAVNLVFRRVYRGLTP